MKSLRRSAVMLSLAALLLGACDSGEDPAPDDAATDEVATDGTEEPEPEPEPDTDGDEDDSSDSEASPEPDAEARVGWAVPGGVDGWEATIVDQQGVNQLQHTETSCQVTFHQNLGALEAAANGDTPASTVTLYIDRIEEEATEVHDRGQAPALVFERNLGGGGEPMEFATNFVNYTGNDGVEYSLIIGAQYVGDVELLAIAACPATAGEGGLELTRELMAQATLFEIP